MPLATLDFRTKNGVVCRSSPNEYPSIQHTYRLYGETWIGHFELLNTCPNSDTITLSGPDVAYAGMTATYSYVGADPSSPFAMLFSQGLNGSVQQEQCFNIGPGVTLGGTGLTSPSGAGSWTSPTIPLGLIGRTVFVEMGVSGPSGVRDSNALILTFF